MSWRDWNIIGSEIAADLSNTWYVRSEETGGGEVTLFFRSSLKNYVTFDPDEAILEDAVVVALGIRRMRGDQRMIDVQDADLREMAAFLEQHCSADAGSILAAQAKFPEDVPLVERMAWAAALVSHAMSLQMIDQFCKEMYSVQTIQLIDILEHPSKQHQVMLEKAVNSRSEKKYLAEKLISREGRNE